MLIGMVTEVAARESGFQVNVNNRIHSVNHIR